MQFSDDSLKMGGSRTVRGDYSIFFPVALSTEKIRKSGQNRGKNRMRVAGAREKKKNALQARGKNRKLLIFMF